MVRLGKQGLIKLTTEQINAMVYYLKHRGDILAFYLYGSYDTAFQTNFSDVDLALLPVAGADFTFKTELAVSAELSILGKSDDINVVNLRKAPLALQMKVLEKGRLLFCADYILLADYTEMVMLHHSDMLPDLQSFYRDYDHGLKKEYL